MTAAAPIVSAADVERVLASTILDRYVRAALRSACEALYATVRRKSDADVIRTFADMGDLARLMRALFVTGEHLTGDLEILATGDDEDATLLATVAERRVSEAHKLLTEALVARAMRRTP